MCASKTDAGKISNSNNLNKNYLLWKYLTLGIHHMALAVKNIEEQLADAEAKGIRLIDKTPRKGAEGMTIAFLHPKSTQGILTELCEDKNN